VSPEYYDQFYLNKLQPATLNLNQAIADHQHILLVGGLGAGKTTLLKYLALACINDLMPDLPPCLPVYLPLRSLVNANSPTNSLHSLHAILRQQLDIYGWSAAKLDAETITKMLSEGQFWLLWDELDDLPEYQRTDIGRQIAQFSDQYPQNPMAIATRNPSLNYILPSFAALEIAPLQSTQVYSFASQWFKLTNPDNPKKIEKFQQLLSSSQSLTEIGTTPLFLSYLCNYFNNFSHIKPDFYRDILYLCLTKWQDCKCVASPEPNTTLSTAQKLDFLSYLAIVALDRHGYIWQNQQLEKDMQDCLATSRDFQAIYPSINHDILYQSLRSQHSLLVELAKGIHSLRHTAIHDYLAAYRIANIKSNVAEKYLLDRIYLKRWHGVIVLTASITQNADQMLQTMKRKIDELVINDSHLQSFLTWVNQQSLQIQTPYKVVTIRALYLDIDLENTRSLDRARALDIAHSRSLERARIKAMGIDNTMETEVDIDYTINLALNLDLALYFTNHPIVELACAIEPDLRRGLQFLRQKFPDPYKDRTNFAKWWQTKGLDWSKKLRALIVHHRKGSQDWKFSDNQLKVLRTYHDANKLLIECLYSAEYVSPLVKGQIESSLLLPQNEYSILTGRG
jgi:predicted NACHT family NTPase